MLVYGNLINTPGAYTVQAVPAGIFLTAVTPNQSANNAPITLTVGGAGFVASTGLQLVSSNGTPFSAQTVAVDSFTQLTATFASNAVPPGTYSLLVSPPSGGSASLTNAFIVLPPGAPKLQTQLILPTFLGRHALATLYVQYANTGPVAMPAPLLELLCTGPAPSIEPRLTLDQSRIVQGYGSYGLAPGVANQVFIVASGAQSGVLNAGESIQVPVYYLGLQEPYDFSQNSVQVALRYWTADDPTPIDWASREQSLQPPSLDSNTWHVIYQNLTSPLTNSGSYVQMLDNNAQYLGSLGEQVVDLDSLWNFAIQQADGYSPLPVLDSATDASLPAPGVALALSRHFSPDLRARNSTGLFGYGWYTPWQATLLVQGSERVEILGEGGSARIFTHNTRGSYFSSAGDSSTLTTGGNLVYQLTDPNGTVTQFRLDGKIDYVQDPAGNRVTAGYNGSGQLATLSHSSGASISLAYNGAGLVSMVTDSAGRSVTYAYDAGNAYLLTATTDDGKVTTYTYLTSGTPAQQHALASVTRAGAMRQFTYDGNGRLASTYVGSGDQLISFGYNLGAVSVSDSQGTAYTYYNYRGLLARATDPLGNTTTVEFDDNLRPSHLVRPTGESVSFDWCGCGSLASFTDELGHNLAWEYSNPLQRLTRYTDARGSTTRYAYDSNGNLLSTTYPDNSVETFSQYSPAGLPRNYSNRRHQAISYSYAPSGQVAQQVLPDGSSNEFAYNARGNLLALTNHPASGAPQVTTFAYNFATDGD